jgi:hypothetical protein
MVLLDGVDQDTVAILLGTDRKDDFGQAEPEHPDCLAVVWPTGYVNREARFDSARRASFVKREKIDIPLFVDPNAVKDVVAGLWHGKANQLSGEHGVHWDIIDEVAEASWKTQVDQLASLLPTSSASGGNTLHARLAKSAKRASRETNDVGPSAGQIIRQRRSAVSFDGKTSISASAFFQMMQQVMPRAEQPQLERPMPWDVWPYDPAIHLLIFVHRVDGLAPGLYCLVRDSRKLSFVQQAMNPEMTWSVAPGCPEDLSLYWLLEGDARKLAVQVSCHQDIAGDSAFSFGMLAEFEGALRERGAWWYPRMFWEAGLLGQVLYLEAEAAGVRATGIGCFFDDPVHEIIGVKELAMQSLYHFTIGGPVEDRRLQMLPPYDHLRPHV